MRSFTSFCVVAFLAGCAAQPAPTLAPATAPVTAPAADAAKVAVLNSGKGAAAVPAAESVATTAAATKKVSTPAGYKAVERSGTTFYCAKVATLGTKFKQEICMTQDEHDEVQRRGENVRQDLRQTTKMCAGGTGAFSCSGA
jgi:predicted ABC-class ATPase